MQRKRLNKRLLSLFLVISLVLSAALPSAWARETAAGDPVVVSEESPSVGSPQAESPAPSVDPEPSPSADPEPTQSAEPTPTVEPSPSAEPTPTVEPSPTETPAESPQPFDAAAAALKEGEAGYAAYQYMTYLSSTIGTRVVGSEQEAQAAAYIESAFKDMGLATAKLPFSYTRSGTTVNSQNVVATKQGKSSRVVYVGAHYDSVSAGKGTDDNASGVGVMLEAAKTVAKADVPYTIKFIAFGGEEAGLRGSKDFVSKMTPEEIKNAVAMINLDSLAAGDNMHIYGSAGYEGFVRELGLDIAERLKLNVTTQQGLNPEYPAGTTGDWSDHAPFKAAGIPYGYLEATNWNLGDMDGYTQTEKDGEIWHTPKDTLDYISQNYPGRIEEHLSTFSTLLSTILLEIAEPAPQTLTLSNNKASITEKRTIDVVFDMPSTSAVGDLKWTFGGKDLTEWKKYKNGGFNGDPFIKLEGTPVVEDGKLKAKLTFDLVFDTTNLSGNRARYPALLGTYDLAVSGKSGNVIGQAPIKLNVYDDYHPYDEIKPALDEIMASPDKKNRYIETKVIGKSVQDRDILFSIVAKDQKAVDDYLNKTLPAMTNDPEGLQKQIEAGTLKDYKVPIWINNIHPDEAPGVDAIINIFRSLVTQNTVTYQTTDDKGAEQTVTLDIDKALDNVIFLLNYTENPDGRYLNTRANSLGFDLNRDNSYQTQPETQQVMGELAKWMPTSFLDFHGFVGQFLIEPCTPPHDPNFEYDLLIDNMVEQATLMGRAGVANTKYDVFHIPYVEAKKAAEDPNYKPIANATGWDDAAPAYTAVFAMHHGALGHTIEIPELNQDSTNALYYTALAATKYLADNKDRLFLNQLEIYKRGMNNEDNRAVDKYLVNAKYEVIGRPRGGNENFFPEYYVLPVDNALQKNPAEAYRMVKYLLHNGVKVERTKTSVKVGDTTYPKGTFVVNMHQASRGFANLVLYDGFNVSDFEEMYSDIIQSFPEMRGFDSYEIRAAGAFKNKTNVNTSENEITIPGTTVPGSSYEYVIRNNGNAAVQAVNELIGAGKKVTLLANGGGTGANAYEKGDFLVSYSNLKTVKDNYLLKVVPFPASGDKTGKVLKPAVVGATARSNPEFVLKQLGFQVTNDLAAAEVLLNAGSADLIKTKPYIGFGRSGMSLFKSAGVAEGFDYKAENAYEGLYRAVFDQDSAITAPYEAEDYLYTNTGSYITAVPKEAKVIATIKDAADFYVAGWWPTHAAAQGKTAGFTYAKDGVNATIFASDSFNKDHPQAQFRLMAEAVYAASAPAAEGSMDDGPRTRPPVSSPGSGTVDTPTEPTPTEPTTPTNPTEPTNPTTPTEPTTPAVVPDFKDLGQARWAVDAIKALAAKGVVTGVSEDSFAPAKQVTRAEFLAMIVRAFGLLDSQASASFSDVPSGSWSYPFVATAVKLNLAQGTGGGKFDPSRPITREEMAVMAANALKLVKGKQAADVEAALKKFKDSDSMASYSKDAIALLTEEGVVSGVSADTFLPKGVATRAEAAVIVYKLMGVN